MQPPNEDCTCFKLSRNMPYPARGDKDMLQLSCHYPKWPENYIVYPFNPLHHNELRHIIRYSLFPPLLGGVINLALQNDT